MQSTDKILMIRPLSSAYNKETAANNFFQNEINAQPEMLVKKAQMEFDNFVKVLRNEGIRVFVFNELEEHPAPDAVFPNNWISFHSNGNIAIFPLFAKSRRRERRLDIIDSLEKEGLVFKQVIDYTNAEKQNIFLEGTGSLVLDRMNKKAYCALSPRSNESLLLEFCEDFEYMPIPFHAFQSVNAKRLPIYHTNVMLCLGSDIAVVCLESIDKQSDKVHILNSLKEDAKVIIEINEEQMGCFAGNMLEVHNDKNEKFLVMSTQAYSSLLPSQLKRIKKHLNILHSPLETIESLGGGSARCMMAELFSLE